MSKKLWSNLFSRLNPLLEFAKDAGSFAVGIGLEQVLLDIQLVVGQLIQDVDDVLVGTFVFAHFPFAHFYCKNNLII
jgi:hypothetical protein